MGRSALREKQGKERKSVPMRGGSSNKGTVEKRGAVERPGMVESEEESELEKEEGRAECWRRG
jgi:hypothetical protein